MNLTYEQAIAIDKIAQADMRRARKEGSILIAQTKFGTVELAYHKENRSYSIRSQGDGERRIAMKNLAASGCATRLSGVYDIRFE